MAVDLVYETHQWSTDNESGRATGWLDGRLSERGIAECARLRERRRSADVVVCSDLRRAVETAEVAFGGLLPIVMDPRLREVDLGDLNGAPVTEVEALRASRVDIPFPGGESYRDVVVRTRDLLRDLTRWDGDRVLLVGHSANRLALDHLLLGASLDELVAAPFVWQEGWAYVLPSGFR